MAWMLCLLSFLLVDEYAKPQALINLERARRSIRTMEVEYWRTYYVEHYSVDAGQPFLRTVTLARDGSMRIVNKGFEGYISTLFDTGQPASVTPLQELHRDGGVWSYKEWELGPDYYGPEGPTVSQADPRALGLRAAYVRSARQLETAIWQIGSPTEVIRYRTTVEGPIHTVTATGDSGIQRIWRINAEKGWNPEEITMIYPPTGVGRIVSDLARYGDTWFPREVVVYDNGKVRESIRITRLEVNQPEHPLKLTLTDIGVEPSMPVHDRSFRPGGGPFLIGPPLVWDGESLISSAEWVRKRKRGEVHYGPKVTAIREQLKQGTYRRPDQDLQDQYNVKRRLTKGTVSAWERYVLRFIEKYRLNDEQRQRAYRILRQCQDRADAYALRHKEELAREGLDRDRRAELMAPVHDIFEKQLKPRLEKLPTRAQRRAAEERDKATSQPSKSKRPG